MDADLLTDSGERVSRHFGCSEAGAKRTAAIGHALIRRGGKVGECRSNAEPHIPTR